MYVQLHLFISKSHLCAPHTMILRSLQQYLPLFLFFFEVVFNVIFHVRISRGKEI